MQHSVGLFSVLSDENTVMPSAVTNIKQFDDATPQKQTVLSSSTALKSSRKALVDLSNGQLNNNRNASSLSTLNVHGKPKSSITLQTSNTLTKTSSKGTQFIIKYQHDENKNNENIKVVNQNIFNKSSDGRISKNFLKQSDGKVKTEATNKSSNIAPASFATEEMLCSGVAKCNAEDVYDTVMRTARNISYSLMPTTGKGMASLEDISDSAIDYYDFSGPIDVPMNYDDFADKVACSCDEGDISLYLVPPEAFIDE